MYALLEIYNIGYFYRMLQGLIQVLIKVLIFILQVQTLFGNEFFLYALYDYITTTVSDKMCCVTSCKIRHYI